MHTLAEACLPRQHGVARPPAAHLPTCTPRQVFCGFREGAIGFLPTYRRGWNAYFLGDWEAARGFLEEALVLKEKDGPTMFVLNVVEENKWIPPEDWKGRYGTISRIRAVAAAADQGRSRWRAPLPWTDGRGGSAGGSGVVGDGGNDDDGDGGVGGDGGAGGGGSCCGGQMHLRLP